MRISNHRTLCNEHSKEEIAWFSLQMNLDQGAKWAGRDEANVEAKMLQVRVGWSGQPLLWAGHFGYSFRFHETQFLRLFRQ